jgi:flagellar motility protein MotE (MotC chaperone)
MASTNKEPKMTREQAMELYDDLQKTMATILKNTGQTIAPTKSGGKSARPVAKKVEQREAPPVAPAAQASVPMRPTKRDKGQTYALVTLGACATIKIVLSILDASGVAKVEVAQATVLPAPRMQMTERFSKQEVEVLTKLDARRAELEERNRSLEERSRDLDRRDREFAAKLTHLRELTGRLQGEREKDDKKRNTQLEQLANVYGSMNPPEAATLLEQLDVTTALALIQKMPEKRMGQILSLMNPQRALTLTKMLSGKQG